MHNEQRSDGRGQFTAGVSLAVQIKLLEPNESQNQELGRGSAVEQARAIVRGSPLRLGSLEGQWLAGVHIVMDLV